MRRKSTFLIRMFFLLEAQAESLNGSHIPPRQLCGVSAKSRSIMISVDE